MVGSSRTASYSYAIQRPQAPVAAGSPRVEKAGPVCVDPDSARPHPTRGLLRGLHRGVPELLVLPTQVAWTLGGAWALGFGTAPRLPAVPPGLRWALSSLSTVLLFQF